MEEQRSPAMRDYERQRHIPTAVRLDPGEAEAWHVVALLGGEAN